ncbi:MAG: hypothetical protein HGA44_05770 [Cellulomonadaceae bacterium]|nr:hypothetical protein [Cellulomonadaceae bacterium]
MIAALLLGAVLATATNEPEGLSVAVSPQHVTIENIGPGRAGSAQVEVVNNGTRAVVLTVSGTLSAPNATSNVDLLQVDLQGCSTPWVGVPDAPVCLGTRAGDRDLSAVPLEVGARTWVLISAGLDARAGNGAQGQTWNAQLSLTAAATTPTPAPALAVTGASVIAPAVAGLLTLAAGAGLVRLRRTRGGTR